jgi:signal transduction histidine kinase
VTPIRQTPTRIGALVAGSVWDFATDISGRLWLGMSSGLCSESNGRFACYGDSRNASGLVDIVSTGDGWFWVARAGGTANAFDPHTARFGDELRLPSAPIMSAYFDRDSSMLWIGGSGLFRARVDGGRVIGAAERVGATVNSERLVYAIFRDSQRTLWLGTDNGLQRWDARARTFTPVDVPELRGSTAFSLQEDADQRLWIGTAHGLVAYSPATGIARRYRREDGVRSGEFNRRAALRTASGEMWFGGVQGITRFHPAAISGRRDAPPIVVTRLRKLTADGLREVALVRSDTSAIRLVPGDRAVTIEFAALAYGLAPARRYRYRLTGLNDEWIESSEHAVTYPTPPPGSYVFHVQAAAGSEGAWSSTSGVLNLEVVPPFSKTAWFRALLLGVTAALLWSLHRLRLARAVATERLRLRIARDLHDQIGAGLSSIALLSDAVGSSRAGLADTDRTELRKIAGAARDMVGDLRDIVWSIDPEADRLQDIVGRMRDVADDLLGGLRVTFDVQPGSHLTRKLSMAARRDLLLLYKESLHNIVRHARATAVGIVLRIDRSRLALVIADDGVGFVPAQATSGVGLRSLRERADRLGARLDVESEPGRGTTVRLELPT